MKKAQGLSMNMMVLAAIALIIFVIVLLIFKGGIGRADKSLNSVNQCESTKGNQCVVGGTCISGQEISGLGCSGTTPVCCVKPEAAQP